MAGKHHKPQSRDRNLNYVADQDQLQQEKRDKAMEQGDERMGDSSESDEGIG